MQDKIQDEESQAPNEQEKTAEPLPEPDENIHRALHPEAEQFESETIRQAFDTFRANFKLVEVTVESRSKRTFWRDIVTFANQKPETKTEMVDDLLAGIGGQVGDLPALQRAKDLGGREDPKNLQEVSENRPVDDFREMLNRKDADQTINAIRSMVKVTTKFIYGKENDNVSLLKAIKCATELRKGCVEEDEPTYWNEFLSSLKKDSSMANVNQFLNTLRNTKVSLITNIETVASDVTNDMAKTFYNDTLIEVDDNATESEPDDDIL